MRKTIPWLVVLLILGLWNWTYTGGTWLTGPTSSDYGAGQTMSGEVVYDDIVEIKNAVNGGLGDTNFTADAEFALYKLQHGTFYHMEGDSNSKKVAYGDLNMHWANVQAAYNLQDTLCPDSAYVFLIDFGDSSDVGNPRFGTTPHIMLGPLSLAGSAVGVGHTMSYDHWQKNIAESLHYCIQWAGAGSCSVYVHYSGNDTVFNGVQMYWEAKQK